MSQLETAREILEQRKKAQATNAQAKAILAERKQAEPGFIERAGQFASDVGQAVVGAVTGEERETRATQELPELTFSGILSGEDTGTVARVAPVLMTTLDPMEQANILKANFPNIGIQQDEKGNIIVGNNRTGVKAVINKPGLSGMDVLQGAGLAAEFTPAARAASGVGNVASKMLRVGAGSGATEAVNQAAQAASGGEFNPGDVAIATGGGAAFEGIFQGLAAAFPVMRESVKTAGGKINDRVREAFKQKAREEAARIGTDPETAANSVTDDVIADILFPEGKGLAGEQEFGIQLTKGQRSGRQADLLTEDDLLTGRVGTPKSQEIMVGRREQTQQQVQDAASDIQQNLGREGTVIGSQQEAGALAAQGIRNAEIAADQAVRESFESVGEAALKPEAFENLFRVTKNAIKGIDFPVTSETPATKSLLKQINSAEKFFKGKGVQLKPQHISRIEQIRRSIGAQVKTAANPTDKRNLTTMKRAYDDFLDDAVKNAMFEGDQTALDSMKSSRSLFREYAKRFRSNPQRTPTGRTIADRPGNFIEEIIDGNPTDIQTVNSLFGAGNTFGNATSKNMAVRFKDILGADSPEWGAIRQAAFKRLVRTAGDGKTISGKQTQKAIADAIEKNGELMKEIFTADEIGMFRRFAAQVVRSQPDIIKGSANPSGTGRIVNRGLAELTSKISAALGFASGNPVLVIAGQGVQAGSGFGAKRAAREAVRPFGAVINARPALVGGATAGTLQLSE